MSAPTFIEEIMQDGAQLPNAFDTEAIGKALDQLRTDIIETSWEQVGKTAAQCLMHGSSALDTIIANSISLSGAGAAIAHGLLMSPLKSKLQSESANEILEPLIDQFSSMDDMEADEAAVIIDQLKGIADHRIDPLVYDTGPSRIGIIPADLALTSLVRGLLGCIHFAFNSVLDQPPIIPFASDKVREASIRSIIERGEDDLQIYIERLYNACRAPSAHGVIISEAMSFRQHAYLSLPRIARVMAHAHHLMHKFLDAGKGTAAERIGTLMVRGHRLIRETMAACVSAQRMASEHPLNIRAPEVETVFRSAEQLPLNGRLPNGLNRQIHQLDPSHDGKFIEISGVVLSTEAEIDNEDRLIGRVHISDPSSNSEITAIGFFINPSRVGMTHGSYISLSGEFHIASTLNEGQPAILIDRLALKTLAKDQWRIAFLELASDWFPVYRNGHNMFWSIGPHQIQGADLDIARSGASELIFLKYGPPPEDGPEEG